MRVISGKYKGIILDGININGTRPTMDRVKESLFGIIQNKVKSSICLDLFAGSASLGIEALSNFSKYCYFVDNSNEAINVINKNLLKINETNALVLKKSYDEALKYFNINNIKFDIIFLDPPYKLNLISKSIKLILEYGLLNENGIIVCEYENEFIDTLNLEIIKQKKYGSKNIMILSN